MSENILIEKLNRLSDVWKAQYQTPLDIPLRWSVVDGMVYLDDVWVAPVAFLKQESLDEAVEWVYDTTIQLELRDDMVDIKILKDFGVDLYVICCVERYPRYRQ